MKDFRDLKVWSKAHNIALNAYRLTAHFPKEEMYGLTSQIRRAGASIPANIAEGCGRDGDGELARFLQIAAGSASELEYHLLLASDLGFIDQENYSVIMTRLTELRRMLTALLGKVRKPTRPAARSARQPTRAVANR